MNEDRVSNAETCTICDATDHVSWLMKKNGYDLYRCAGCDHIFVSSLPSNEELDRAYSFESGYQVQKMVPHEDRPSVVGRFYDSLALIRNHTRSGTLLDVG